MSDSDGSLLRIVLLGPPASGKGTQGRRLAASLGLGYLSTGALLREEMERQTDLGKLAEPILDRGEYLPDDLMCRILGDWLSRQTRGWVLDGFPRSLPQAEFLDQWLKHAGLSLDAAVSLDVPYAELLLRIRERVECPGCRWSGQKNQCPPGEVCPKCGGHVQARADDSAPNFNSRYKEFQRLSGPAIEYYRRQNLLMPCRASAPQDEVAQSIFSHFRSKSGVSAGFVSIP